MASELGVTQQAITNWERGQIPRDFRHLPGLAAFYDVEILDLLDPEWQLLYEGVLFAIEQTLFEGASDIERNLEVMRASRELRQWQVFLTRGTWDESETEDDGDIQKTLHIYEQMRKQNQ